MAEFEDMLTEEEREMRELEERRRKRAALEAKLVQAPPAAQAPAEAEAEAAAQARSVADVAPDNGGADKAADDLEEAKAVDSGDDTQDAQGLFRTAQAATAGVPASMHPGSPAAQNGAQAGGTGGDDEVDIFADDDDSPAPARTAADADVVAEADSHDDRLRVRQAEQFRKPTTGLSDMYDDSQGYYNFRIGELMGGRYEVIKASGKGVFSSVVTALDKLRQDATGANPLVAVKMIRANDVMAKAGKLELAILDKLAAGDPDGRKHVIRLLRSFEYRNHLCMVFEHMEMNLRELTRKVGVGRGLKIDAVGQLALQMLIALKHLRATRVLHADIKPDNILINSRMNKIKLCDLGSAAFADAHNELTPYLVSRFYRAPEVMLGLPYDYPMDMWSIACTVYELFTADILFKGRTNNEMLKLIMELKGSFPKKMVKKGLFAAQHFADDANLSFISMETDVVTKQPVKRLISNPAKKRTFLQMLTRVAAKEYGGRIPREELRKVEHLAEFLERATVLDPAARLTPADALQTKFIVAAKQQIASQQAAQRKAQ